MNIVWLRRDLRTIDNTALIQAIETGLPTVALFIATPKQWQEHSLAPIQADLIARRLDVLAPELAKLNVPLLYAEVPLFEDCHQVIADFVHRLSATQVFTNKEYEFNEINRDEDVEKKLAVRNVKFQSYDDKCVLAPRTVLNQKGQYFKVFTPFKRSWLAQFSASMSSANLVQKPQTSVRYDLPEELKSSLWSESSIFSYHRQSSQAWPVATQDVIHQLREFCSNDVDSYQKQRDFPELDKTSRLSAYLAIGAISVRQCIARLCFSRAFDRLSEGAQTWLSELIWREFYQHLLVFEPKLSKGISFVSWERHLLWSGNEVNHFEKWKAGETGYPIVDAAMKQLNHTGWMHNRLRMIVASFLTKDLHVDWRLGELYFMSKLIDGDYAANNGGWQWCASTGCDGQPYFRIFNPTSQGEKFDPSGRFVRCWLPELKSVEDKWVHQPWNAPNASMLSYPKPMVDHKVERALTLSLYKQAKDSAVHADNAE